VEEEVLVGLVELLDVGRVRTVGLLLAVVRAEAFVEQLGRGLEIDDQVGKRHVARQQLVEPLVDEQVVVVEVQVGVDPVLLEQVVADRRLAEEVGLPQRLLLPVAIEEEEQLRLEAGAGPLGVEVGQERVVGFLRTAVASTWAARRSASAVLPTPGGPSRAI
jgi:hypothetical protein